MQQLTYQFHAEKRFNPLMVSLAQEHFPETERQFFGPNFEQRLKTRSQTAETIGKASRMGKPFFRGGASRGFQRPRGGRQWNHYRQFRPFQPNTTTRGSTILRVRGQSTRFQSPRFQSPRFFKPNQ